MRQQMTFINIILLIFMSIIFISCGADDKNMASKEGQLWTCGMHPEVLLDEPGQCPKCGMNLTPVKQTGTSEAEHEHQAEPLYTCPMHPEVLTEEPGSCPKCGMDLVPVKQDKKDSIQSKGERKILYWQAPMDPTEIYDYPGKSKMGMDLIPVYEDRVITGSAITIDPVTVQNMGVRVAPVRRIEFSRILRATGNIDYNEEKLFMVNSKINGWVEKLYVSFTGQQVRKGQPLLEIYSPELVTTQEEYLLALKNKDLVSETTFDAIREGAESLVNAAKKRLLYWDISPEEIQRLEKERKVRKTITLRAPANGVVTQKNAVEGSRVNEGMNLYQIADLSTVWVYASVYDYEVPWIHVDQTAEMELAYNPGKIYKGMVSYIYPYVNEKARDVRIRMEFPNEQLDLKPGMYANVTIKAALMKDALVVPAEALLRSGTRNIVFVTREQGRFEPREVKIGEEGENGTLRIISGLLEGEKVVISAQFLLDSESRLQEAIQKMLAEKNR
jgi:Cu(I)/Ag(I) efflux system membrane fusion protein